MTTTTTTKIKNLDVTIKELHKAYDKMNKTFFKGELTPVLITIHTGSKNVLGWYTPSKMWDNGKEEMNEICLVAENLQRGKMQILQTLLHEAIHHYCNINDIRETSRNGRWHNKRFKEQAELHGMEYTHEQADPKIGYSAVTLTQTSYDTIDSWNLNEEAFQWYRKSVDKGEKKKKTNSYKWTCGCGQIARTSKPSFIAFCPDCEEQFQMEE
jgi:hypothetical protein